MNVIYGIMFDILIPNIYIMKEQEINERLKKLKLFPAIGQCTTKVIFKNGIEINGHFSRNLGDNKWEFNKNFAGHKEDITIDGEEIKSIQRVELRAT